MEQDWVVLLEQTNTIEKVMNTNQAAERYGLELTRQDAELILQERGNALKEQRRIEFGEGIAEKLIYEFCDSHFLTQDSYAETIIRLQEIFYLYKNEMNDEITDDELLHLMKEQYEQICFGDLDYLETTGLANFAQAVRAGYGGFQAPDGYGQALQFDEVQRWDYDLYLETLRELCWG